MHSRRIDPINLSAKPFCQGEPEAMGLSRMPMARNRVVTAAPWTLGLRKAHQVRSSCFNCRLIGASQQTTRCAIKRTASFTDQIDIGKPYPFAPRQCPGYAPAIGGEWFEEAS
jgi:hypothetical protein